jgi:hypothetical protein
MTLAYPRSGRNWGGGVPLGRRAAVPRGTRRGLGQDGEAADIEEGGTYVPPSPSPGVYTPPGSIPPFGSTQPWYAAPIATGVKTLSTIASYQLNPLYQKATYYQTPQGAIYASNVPSGYVPGLTTATGGISLLPILLIGGLVLLFMARR